MLYIYNLDGTFDALNTNGSYWSTCATHYEMSEKYETNDIIKVCYNLENNSLSFYKNNILVIKTEMNLESKNECPESLFYLPTNNSYCLCIANYGYENTKLISEKVFYQTQTPKVNNSQIFFFCLSFFRCFF